MSEEERERNVIGKKEESRKKDIVRGLGVERENLMCVCVCERER